MHQDDQENPWPGFVDMMSSTLLVFVFLVIIQLLVIAGVSMKIGKNISEKRFEKILEKRISEVTASTVEKASAPPPKPLPVPVSGETLLTIIYPNLDTLPSAEENQRIDDWVALHKQQLHAQKIHISGFIGLKDLSMSTSSFVSFNRVMDIRSRLIKQGVPIDNITVRINDQVPENTPPESRNAVIVEIQP